MRNDAIVKWLEGVPACVTGCLTFEEVDQREQHQAKMDEAMCRSPNPLGPSNISLAQPQGKRKRQDEDSESMLSESTSACPTESEEPIRARHLDPDKIVFMMAYRLNDQDVAIRALFDQVNHLIEGRGVKPTDCRKEHCDQEEDEQYTFSKYRDKYGELPSREKIDDIIQAFTVIESSDEPKTTWLDLIFKPLWDEAIAKFPYENLLRRNLVQKMEIRSDLPRLQAKAKSIDRKIDYCIGMVDEKLFEALGHIETNPVGKDEVVSTCPSVINIRTDCANKYKHNEGLIRLAAWTYSQMRNFQAVYNEALLKQDTQQAPETQSRWERKEIYFPAIPLLLTQGRWSVLYVARYDSAKEMLVIWGPLDLPSCCNQRNIYKLVAILQCLFIWGLEQVREWFKAIPGNESCQDNHNIKWMSLKGYAQAEEDAKHGDQRVEDGAANKDGETNT